MNLKELLIKAHNYGALYEATLSREYSEEALLKEHEEELDIPDTLQQRELLIDYDHFAEQKHCWYMGTEDETKEEFIKIYGRLRIK